MCNTTPQWGGHHWNMRRVFQTSFKPSHCHIIVHKGGAFRGRECHNLAKVFLVIKTLKAARKSDLKCSKPWIKAEFFSWLVCVKRPGVLEWHRNIGKQGWSLPYTTRETGEYVLTTEISLSLNSMESVSQVPSKNAVQYLNHSCMIHGLMKQTQACVSFIALWSQNGNFWNSAKLSVFRSVFVLILTYGHESWLVVEQILSQLVQAAKMRFLRRVHGFATKCAAVTIPKYRAHFSESRNHSYDGSAMFPGCHRKDWRGKTCWLNPRESGPGVVQWTGGVTTSPTLLGHVLVWNQQNYLRLPLTVRYSESSQSCCSRNPTQSKSGYEHEWIYEKSCISKRSKLELLQTTVAWIQWERIHFLWKKLNRKYISIIHSYACQNDQIISMNQ